MRDPEAFPPTAANGLTVRGGQRWNDPMIRDIEIENFRCFERVKLDGLGRVNVVVGDSAAGKTALLEAIFLASAGNPDKALVIRGMRGLATTVISRTREFYEGLWRDLFYDLDQSQAIRILLKGDSENTRSLKIWYDKDSRSTMALPAEGQLSQGVDSSAITPITFESQHASEQAERVQPEITATELRIASMNRSAPALYFSPAAMLGSKDNATRLSQLRIEGKDGPIQKAMKSLYPQVGQISVEVVGEGPIIYATPFGKKSKQKLPLALVSSGVSKVLSMLLALASTPNGVVLFDEIENGIYYHSMPDVWEELVRMSKKSKTQIFATTHSRECLESIQSLIEGHEDDFRLIRAERGPRGDRHLKLFGGRQFKEALAHHFEIR